MTAPNTLLTFSHVDAGYPHRPVLADVNLSISRRDFIVLTGSNGGGKTTLVRLMLGLMRPTAGRLWRMPHIVMGYQPQYQHIDRQFPITVEELVLTGLQNRLRPWQRFRDEHRQRVTALLERFDLAPMSRRLVSQLSGGQLQRALFARAVVSEPDLLVIDEPDTYLDARHKQLLYDFLGHITPETAIVMVSHDAYVPAHLAGIHLHVDHGTVSRL